MLRLLRMGLGDRLTLSALDGVVRLDDQPLRDLDVVRIRLALEAEHCVRTRMPDVRCALDLLAGDHTVHPIREWLAGQVPGDAPRLDRVLIDYVGAEDTPLIRRLGAAWLIDACARVFEPGCPVDGALVLVASGGGPGAAGVAGALVPNPHWCGASPVDIGSKDALIQVHGSWIFEMHENESLSLASSDAREEFLLRTHDRVKPRHATRIEDHPRQSVVVVTTSLESLPQTPLIGPHLWTVLVGDADLQGLRRDGGALFAEAYARYRAGASRRLDDADLRMLAAVQEQLRQVDRGEQRLESWVMKQDQPFAVELAALLGLGLRVEPMRAEALKQRVGRMLHDLGCVRVRPRAADGRRPWCWARPPKWGLVV